MDQGQNRLCPRCGTPRVGSFRWCRSCQYDFDESHAPAQIVDHPFELTPPGQFSQAPQVSPAPPLVTDSAASAPPPVADSAPAPASMPAAPTPRAPARARTPIPPIVIVAVVAVFSLVAIGFVGLLLPDSAPVAASPSAPSPADSSTTTSSAAPTASPAGSATTTSSAAPTASPATIDDQTVIGQGPGDADFAFPDSTGIATITNTGAGAFAVWKVGPDGARLDQLVDAHGAYVGTRRFASENGRVAFAIESDGAWSIEVKPFSDARTWNHTEPLVGDGDDVVLVFPATKADLPVNAISDGALGVAAYAGGPRQQLVDEAGPFRGELVLPAGTSVLEIAADGAWSLRPQ